MLKWGGKGRGRIFGFCEGTEVGEGEVFMRLKTERILGFGLGVCYVWWKEESTVLVCGNGGGGV